MENFISLWSYAASVSERNERKASACMSRHQASALGPRTSVGVLTVSAPSENCRVVGLNFNGWSVSLRSGELCDTEADLRA
jgi:hypothetical protein